MIKVLIVDDERLVRIGIRSALLWEDHGFTVVGEACNGEDALQKIELLQPELLLTDIRMPKMDGIQLLQELERRKVFIETIIMSCYNEFELVRAAMKYGASDYLLKVSLSNEDMLETLLRSRQRILSKRDQNQRLNICGEIDYRAAFTRLVIDPSVPFSDLSSIIERLNVQLNARAMAMLLLSVDPIFDKVSMSYSTPASQSIILLGNLLHDELVSQHKGDAFVMDRTKGEYLVCLNLGMDLKEIVAEIQAKAKVFFNATLSICVLDYSFCSSHFFSSVKEAAQRLAKEKFSLGRKCTFNFADDMTIPIGENPSPLKNAFNEIRDLNDLHRLLDQIRCISKQMEVEKIGRETCLVILTEIFYKAIAPLQLYGGSIDGLNKNSRTNLFSSLQQLAFLEDAVTWFTRYVQLIEEYLTVCEGRRKRKEILSALDYINKNYNLPISAQKVAHQVGISEAYFCTLFKKEIGYGFSEYLTNLRIERAKQLLADKSIYIYEICEYVGYSDANYFSKVFKKNTNLSPEAYRKERFAQK